MVVEADAREDALDANQSQDQANDHSGEDGYDRLMYRLDALGFEDVAGEEGGDEEDDEDEQGPGGEDLLLAGLGSIFLAVGALPGFQEGKGGADEESVAHGWGRMGWLSHVKGGIAVERREGEGGRDGGCGLFLLVACFGATWWRWFGCEEGAQSGERRVRGSGFRINVPRLPATRTEGSGRSRRFKLLLEAGAATLKRCDPHTRAIIPAVPCKPP